MNGPKLGTIAPPAGRVRVYQISADKLLGALPDRSIDLVIADGPYLTVNRASASGHLRDWFDDGLTWPQMSRVFALARAKLKPDGVLMAMTNNDGLREAIGAMERAGFIGIRTITWDRQYPGLGGGMELRRPWARPWSPKEGQQIHREDKLQQSEGERQWCQAAGRPRRSDHRQRDRPDLGDHSAQSWARRTRANPAYNRATNPSTRPCASSVHQ